MCTYYNFSLVYNFLHFPNLFTVGFEILCVSYRNASAARGCAGCAPIPLTGASPLDLNGRLPSPDPPTWCTTFKNTLPHLQKITSV